jgi:BMFP domain-containing protein YqiC
MFNQKLLDDIVREIGQRLPPGLGEAQRDIEKTVRGAVEGALSRMGLVTREEFDIQAEVLARSRERLEALEQQIAELEGRAPKE